MCHISHALQSLLTDFCGIITVILYSRTDTDEKWINNNYNFGINDCRACNLWQRKFGRVLEPLLIYVEYVPTIFTTITVKAVFQMPKVLLVSVKSTFSLLF